MAIGNLCFFVIYLLILPIGMNDGISLGVRLLTFLIPQGCIAYIYSSAFKLELLGKGLTFATLFTKVDNCYIIVGILFLFVSLALWWGIALLLDMYIQGNGGKQRRLCSCGGKKQNQAYDAVQTSDLIEEQEYETNAQLLRGEALKVNGLTKVYDDGKVAVNNLNLSMAEGKIFALLGPNGAGKTTAISMLCGLLPPTEGKALYQSNDLLQNPEKLYSMLGLCPQDNIFYEKLTVEEHLQIFGIFKGINQHKVKEECNRLLSELNFPESRLIQAQNLSGGQKRKLSISIAFLGDPRVIMLDEPSSGLDASARKKLWDMIKKNKQGKIIILTTHYMEEADRLGDKIAIMTHGVLRCCGSSLFLKNKFGGGYMLSIVNKKGCNQTELDAIVTKVLPQSSKVSQYGNESTYQLNFESVGMFKEAFEYFDHNKEQIGFESYSVSIPTLDDVFLSVVKSTEVKTDNEEVTQVEVKHQYSIADDPLKANCLKHFQVGFVKKFKQTFRTLRTLIEIFVPVMFLTIGILYIKFLPFSSYNTTDTMESIVPPIQNMFTNKYYFVPKNGTSQLNQFVDFPSDYFTPTVLINNEIATDQTNLYDYLSAYYQSLNQTMKDMDNGVSNYGSIMVYYANATLIQAMVFGNISNPHTFLVYGNLLMQQLFNVSVTLNTIPLDVKQRNSIIGDPLEFTTGVMFTFYLAIAFAFIPGFTGVYYLKERVNGQRHQQHLSGMSSLAYWLSNYFMDSIKMEAASGAVLLLMYICDIKIHYGWLILILFPFVLMPYAYLFQLPFTKEQTLMQVSMIVGTLLGSILAVTWLVLITTGNVTVARILEVIFLLYPIFNAINAMLKSLLFIIFASAYRKLSTLTLFSFEMLPLNLIIGLAEAFIFIFITNYLDTRVKTIGGRARITQNNSTFAKKDDDVREEEKRVLAEQTTQDAIRAIHLRKEFGKLAAVDDVTFGLGYGEIFALLGMNGAGKSTSFKMITTDEIPTSGSIIINNYSIYNKGEFAMARKIIGYCPQNDAIFEDLTVYEHLKYYCEIKNVRRDMQDTLINEIVNMLDFKEHLNKQGGKLSGGFKRRLTMAIALIGNPPIMLMDEPSTGVDPAGRRLMWKLINRISKEWKKSCVVITTHSMEEADVVSTKIGIMSKGNFLCYGSSYRLKSKYGKGYEIQIKLKPIAREEIEAAMKQYNIEDVAYNNQTVSKVLNQIGMVNLTYEIAQGKSGSHLYDELIKSNKISANEILSYALSEKKISLLKEALTAAYKKYEVLEDVYMFIKVRIPLEGNCIGGFFEFMEKQVY